MSLLDGEACTLQQLIEEAVEAMIGNLLGRKDFEDYWPELREGCASPQYVANFTADQLQLQLRDVHGAGPYPPVALAVIEQLRAGTADRYIAGRLGYT